MVFTCRHLLILAVVTAIVELQISFSTVSAGEFNPTLNIGDAAPSWSGLQGVDGKKHASDDLKEKAVVVVTFTCNTCPTAVDYEDRLIALTKKYAAEGRVAVVAINSNLVADDLLEKMVQRAKAKSFNFSYLHDETQQTAKAYGASYTPEFFVLDRDRKVIYMGAMDDSSDPTGVKQRFVEDAIAAALAGKKPAQTETAARGCAIRFVSDRKKKAKAN